MSIPDHVMSIPDHVMSSEVETSVKVIFFENKFAVSKNVRIFAVQYRGIEQLVARRAHNPEAGGSSPPPATKRKQMQICFSHL